MEPVRQNHLQGEPDGAASGDSVGFRQRRQVRDRGPHLGVSHGREELATTEDTEDTEDQTCTEEFDP